MKKFSVLAVGLLMVSAASAAAASQQTQDPKVITPAVPPGYKYMQPFAYPAGGQDAAQQATDNDECHAWAGEHLGFDPRSPYESVAAVAAQLQVVEDDNPIDGSAAKGAAKGAAAGALIGWATGDAGKGAAIGAATGGVLGRAGGRQRKQAEKAAAEQAAKDYEQAQYEAFMFLVGKYDEALGLCLGSRDYALSN